MRRLLKFFTRLVEALILLLIIGFFLLSFTLFNKRSEELPEVFGRNLFAIQTDSMAPLINKGDLIISKSYHNEELRVGDVISFKAFTSENEEFINTHRIIEIKPNGEIRTQGDNLEEADLNTIRASDVYAIYTGYKIGYLGYLLTSLNTSLGFFLIIVLPVLLFTLWQIIKLIRIIINNRALRLSKE